jgi:hypothetical protein
LGVRLGGGPEGLLDAVEGTFKILKSTKKMKVRFTRLQLQQNSRIKHKQSGTNKSQVTVNTMGFPLKGLLLYPYAPYSYQIFESIVRRAIKSKSAHEKAQEYFLLSTNTELK